MMLEQIKEAEQVIMKTYNRFPVILDHGEGVHLYDTDGKEYLDFGAGIAVCALGYSNETLINGMKNQMDKLMHTSNLFYHEPMIAAAKQVIRHTGLDKVFFTNSGTEAIEGALKVARKYAYQKDSTKDYEFIAMNHSFHGRSQGALAVTGNTHYQEGFVPEGLRAVFAEYNNLEDVASKITDKTCGIILETVQGEGGIYPATQEFMEGIRALCDKYDVLMIVDEIQCGMGRTGTMFAYQQYGVMPDVLTCAKALGCGVPVGAFVTAEKCSHTLVPGDHGTTYGGNPFATAAVNLVFDIYEEKEILSHVCEVGAYLTQELEKLVSEYDCIVERRGMNLMQGLQFTIPVGPIVSKSIENGLIVISAGNHTIRLVPPLVITKDDVDDMMVRLKKSISEI
ncbi:MAG: aspartate aminotransferase family protein [Lachnospiraceae bacterium]